MRICDILRRKGLEVVTIAPDRTVLEAVQILVEHNIGAVVVVDGPSPIGILSERDVLRLTARAAALSTLLVREAMTTDLVTGNVGDKLHHVMNLMTQHRIRHLPIMDGPSLDGIVSIGDLVNELRRDAESENQHLKEYISGAG